MSNILTPIILKYKNWRYLQMVRRAKKVILGAGHDTQAGWIATNKSFLDITNHDNFLKLWHPKSRLAFLAEHVWEHLTEDESERANVNCYEFLRPNGWLRLAVPDGFHPDPIYIKKVMPGGSGAGANDHKILYNYKTLSKSLVATGFCVKLLEYWDEQGHFHFINWDPANGMVSRSSRFDPRNRDGMLAYTSLIVDAFRPE